MAITRRTYADVYRDGKKRVTDFTPANNFNSTGLTRALVDMQAVEMDRLYDIADYIYRAFDPTRSIGSDLDKLGLLVGENRLESVVATDFTYTNFHFMIDSRLNWSVQDLIEQNYTPEERDILEDAGYITRTGNSITGLILPVGTIVQNTGGTITYTTTQETTLVGIAPGYATIVANAAGSNSNVQTNVLIAHKINTIPELRKIAHFIKCTNTYPIQNGAFSLTDDEFRYNIATSKAAIPTNELSVRRAALSVPGVRDVIFQRHKFGNGTYHVIIDGVSPLISNGLITSVEERLRQTSSFGDNVFVTAPEYLGVELKFFIRTDPTIHNDSFLRDTTIRVILQYINDLPIGGEIIWNQIISDIIEIEGIEDVIPSEFKYGKYDPLTKINKKQTILRFMNQRAKYNQKWYTDSGLITCCS